MEKIGAWQVGAGGPVRLGAVSIELERHLEEWIEKEPQLVGDGLEVIARQLTVEGGGRLDLLALDPQGRLVVIEVKRAQLEDLALTQSLAYAALLARESTDQLYERIAANAAGRGIELPADLRSQLEVPEGELREVISVVVGAGMGVGMQALLDYLSGRFGVPLRAVSFQVFGTAGSPLLVREITEVERAGGAEAPGPRYSVETVLAAADEAGVGPALRAITSSIQRHDVLYPRPYRLSIMCAPAANRTRGLFTYAPAPGSQVQVWIAPDVFEQFLGVDAERVNDLLAEAELPTPKDGWFVLAPDAVDAFECVHRSGRRRGVDSAWSVERAALGIPRLVERVPPSPARGLPGMERGPGSADRQLDQSAHRPLRCQLYGELLRSYRCREANSSRAVHRPGGRRRLSNPRPTAGTPCRDRVQRSAARCHGNRSRLGEPAESPHTHPIVRTYSSVMPGPTTGTGW